MANELKVLNELEKRKNESDFFDKFVRLEQKSRVMDNYPNVNNLIRLELKGQLLNNIYSKVKVKEVPIKGPNGELAGFKKVSEITETPECINKCNEIYETIKLQKMEYSISIDGAGRKEFIKTVIEPKQSDLDDEEKADNIVDKIANKMENLA